jgi:transposase InsO family protein
MPAVVEARGLAIRGAHPAWGPSRIAHQLLREGVEPVDRICAENGIGHLLTAPYTPTTTGKVEWLHKTMRAEFFNDHQREFAAIAQLQAALDGWVAEYNTEPVGRWPAAGGAVRAGRALHRRGRGRRHLSRSREPATKCRCRPG